MRNGRLGHFKAFCQSADAHLSFNEQGDDANAAGVTEGAKEFGELNGFKFLYFSYAQPISLAKLAVRNVTTKAVPNVITTLNVAHL